MKINDFILRQLTENKMILAQAKTKYTQNKGILLLILDFCHLFKYRRQKAEDRIHKTEE